MVWGPVVWDSNRDTPKEQSLFIRGSLGIQTTN